ncbi:MAG: sugar phosphate isomerase/epimerase [Ruminococcaceae bacterium]|nr:sugar phosphate isomerase/epimerase [Oscillospiraceae bacterium]
MISKIGLQLWTIRDSLKTAEDIRDSFRKMKALGYDVAQTAGCDIPYEDFGRIAREEGIEICGTHDSFDRMTENPELEMEHHRLLGTTNMGIGGYNTDTVEQVESFIERANKLADIIYPHGFKFTFHHHSDEFQILENGKTAMDMLVEGLDPVKTSFVIDTYWLQHGGRDIRHWIEMLEGRIDILHLKEMGRNAEGPFITEVGSGGIWWEGVLETAVKAGVKYFVVEQDYCPGDPFDSIKKSADYLAKFIK